MTLNDMVKVKYKITMTKEKSFKPHISHFCYHHYYLSYNAVPEFLGYIVYIYIYTLYLRQWFGLTSVQLFRKMVKKTKKLKSVIQILKK